MNIPLHPILSIPPISCFESFFFLGLNSYPVALRVLLKMFTLTRIDRIAGNSMPLTNRFYSGNSFQR